MTKHGINATFYSILTRTQGSCTTPGSSRMTGTTGRLPRYRANGPVSNRATTFLGKPPAEKPGTDGSHRSPLNYGMSLETNGITATAYYTNQKTMLQGSKQNTSNYKSDERRKQVHKQTLPDQDRGQFIGTLE